MRSSRVKIRRTLRREEERAEWEEEREEREVVRDEREFGSEEGWEEDREVRSERAVERFERLEERERRLCSIEVVRNCVDCFSCSIAILVSLNLRLRVHLSALD